MEVKGRFDHFNINVLDLEKSIAFYNKALGLKEHHRKVAEDGSFILVYLTDEQTGFLMELTWLRDRKLLDRDITVAIILHYYITMLLNISFRKKKIK